MSEAHRHAQFVYDEISCPVLLNSLILRERAKLAANLSRREANCPSKNQHQKVSPREHLCHGLYHLSELATLNVAFDLPFCDMVQITTGIEFSRTRYASRNDPFRTKVG